MYKVTGIIRQDSAVGFYRIVQPLRFFKRQNLADSRMTFFSGDNVYGEYNGRLRFPEDMMKKILDGTDIIWSNFCASRDEMLRMLDYRKHTGGKLIIDIDDNIYAVSNDNAVKTTKQLTDEIGLSLKIADGITTSVPALKELYSNLNKNIYVKPNSVDFNLWKRHNKKHTGIRIGWEGAYGHRADLEIVYPAIKQLIKDYDITFVILGATPKQGLKQPDFPVEFHEWVGVKHYPKKISSLSLDIAIAPLIDSSYNRCKSNLRILEHSALKIPVVASLTENQKEFDCLHATSNYEWYDQLEKLIKSEKLRKEQGQRQYDYIQEFLESKQVVPLLKWMKELPRRKDLEP